MSYRGPLPDFFVETLFATLTVAWGTAFTDQYKGLDMSLVKADWAKQLGGFFEPEAETIDGQGDSAAIRYALDHLPERPINVMAFRKLCAQYLAPSATALPPPRGPVNLPPEVQREFNKLREPTPDAHLPLAVRQAQRYLQAFGNVKNPPERIRKNLEHYHRVLANWNRNRDQGMAS
jgi:hypothetical protein